MVHKMFTEIPWMWNSGMMLMHTSLWTSCKVLLMLSAPHVIWPCVSGTILGFFVVPDVCRTRAISSRAVGSAWALANGSNGFWTHCRSKIPVTRGVEPLPSPSMSMATPFAVSWPLGTISMSGSPRAKATFAAVDSVAPCMTTTALAGMSSNSNSNSPSFKPGFSGAYVQKRHMPTKATAASGPLGMITQTRSCRVMPSSLIRGPRSVVINSNS
mmetsp:Transcript_48884/g.137917  ORF Transcript_48884/g.137917 Transcript_48884/m.137917 type:complete len:214 (+) Transcript_48884:8314-8955(+)